MDDKKFLDENLIYGNAQFDVVLCWNLPDYMEENLVKPTIDRLWSVMKPGGLLLAFFHTRDAGPDSICYVPAAADQEIFDNSDLWQLFQQSSYRPMEVYVLAIEASAAVLQSATLMEGWRATRAERGYAGPFLQRWLGH